MKSAALYRKPKSSAGPAKARRHAMPELRAFATQQEDRPTMAELYRRDETQWRKRRKDQKSKSEIPNLSGQSQRLLHELEVHQVELELQNTELQQARDELELALEKYTDLYHFAPVGYFTLDADSAIHLVNLTGARLVGLDRSRLVGYRFGLLVVPALRPLFNSFLK